MAVPYEQVIAIAERVANAFHYLWQLSYEDRVQECLLKWVELESQGYFINKQFLFKSFHNHLGMIARKYKVEALVDYDDTLLDAQPSQMEDREVVVVALPKEWGPTRRFTRILFEKGCVRDAADEMGIPYTRAYHWWKRVKRKVREMAEVGNYSPEDILMEVELRT